MFRKTLATWNIKQFRLVIILFFLALCIPTLFLIFQAYSQLKWESFHHYRLQAEELVTRIDSKYHEMIETESSRAFTDYSFLNIAADTKENYLQRSPLAKYPVTSTVPGVLGYFQIDNNGKFTTPLLPASDSSSNKFTLSKKERGEREKVQSQIYTILSQNRLIEKQGDQVVDKEIEEKPAIALAHPAQIQRSMEQRAGISAMEPTIQSKTHDTVNEPVSQSAFDNLQSSNKFHTSETQSYSNSLGRIEDLKLKKSYSKKSSENKTATSQSWKQDLQRQKSSLRKEQNILPTPVKNKTRKTGSGKKESILHISMFESEIDAFEFSMLESGHFVLYRKVWKNGQRYIQGMIVEPKKFIDNIIRQAFYNTSVSDAANLAVAYQGNILSAFSSKSSSRTYSSANEFQGTLLLQKRLSSALDQLELIFSVKNLPAGPGGTVVIWLSLILILVLFGGFYTLYHLGVKQINLARQQQDFVSAVSHELKTPLTSIRMYSEMLREDWAEENKRKSYYDYIYTESERLTRLINNVLQLARLGRNELQVELRPVVIGQLFDMLRSKISSQAERAGFTLHLECDHTIENKTIDIDEDYFSQIMINLVDNAIKFSSASDTRKIDIHCHGLRSNKVRFSIRDYGPGIEKDQIKKIFHLFYRTENELTRKTVGTGIGLSLVKQFVLAMNAEIDVLNRQPGTEFQITFPLNPV